MDIISSQTRLQRFFFFFFLIPWFYSVTNKIMQNHSTSKDAITLNEVLCHSTEKSQPDDVSHQSCFRNKCDILGKEFVN